MMKLPRLARNTILYIAVPVLQRGVFFLLIPILTRYLTPAEYGAWGYINVTATMLGTLVPLGLTSTYYHALKNPKGWPVPPEPSFAHGRRPPRAQHHGLASFRPRRATSV